MDDLTPFDLTVVVPEAEHYDRVVAALTARNVQLLDAGLAAPRARVGVLAIVGKGGEAKAFISRNQRVEHAPSRDAITESFQRLLDRGRYLHGALLVLGRDNLRSTTAPEAPYPALLHGLPAEIAAEDRARRSARGIAGIPPAHTSAASGVLWWEFARGTNLASSLRASYAFERARIAFRSVAAAAQAAAAADAARAAERAAQYDLFRGQEPPKLKRLKYEVMPTTYLESSSVSDGEWALPLPGRSARWRPLTSIKLDVSALDQADFEESPLVPRTFAIASMGDRRHCVQVAFDVAPRLAFDAPSPATGLRLRYGMYGSNVEVQPGFRVAGAGETVEFTILGDLNSDTELALTCTGSAEQQSTVLVTTGEHTWGRNGRLRFRSTV